MDYGFLATSFIVFSLLHFIADWMFQPDGVAVEKTNNSKIRTGHCMIYSVLVSSGAIMSQYVSIELGKEFDDY